MSKGEILQELPRLKPNERREIFAQLGAMDGFADEWIDEEALSADEETVIADRIADLARHPDIALSQDEMIGRLNRRLGL